MCPNCILNKAATLAYIGPILVCGLFGFIAWYFMHQGRQSGDLAGDQEEAKYGVFED